MLMFFNRLRPVLLACTALGVIHSFSAAVAQEASAQGEASAQATQLETIVVKGKRVKASLVAGSPTVSENSAEEMRKNEVDTVADLGNTTEPSVDFVRAGVSGGNMYIRGLGGARVTTLIDNIPVPFIENYPRSAAYSPTTQINDSSNAYDFGSLSSADVMKGADSSRIGSGALGGAMVLRTLEPEDLLKDGRDWGAISKTTYDSEDSSIGTSLAASKKIGNTSVLFQGSYKKGHERDNQGEDDIIGSSRTVANPADFKQTNLLFKVRQDLEGGHRIGLTAERFNLDSEVDLKTMQGTFVSLPWVNPFTPGDYFGYEDTRRERASIDYTFESPETDALIDAAMLTVYWQRLTKSSGSYGTRYSTGADYARYNDMEESSVGVTGGLVSKFEMGTVSHEVGFGGNLQYFDSQQFLTAIPATTASQSDIPDVVGTRLGLYLDDKISFGDSGFSLTPGIRFDWYDYRPQDSADYQNNTGYSYFGIGDAQSDARFSPKLLASYQLTPEVELFAQWSMAYRAPTVSELYANFTNAAQGYSVLGNPELEAETANGFEVGAKYESNDFVGRVTAYHNRYKNFINEVDTTKPGFPGTVYTWENLDRVVISGVEVSARKEFANGIFLHGNLTLAYGENKETGEYLRTVAPVKSILGIGYAAETWGADLSTILQAGMRDDGDATTFDAPGYGIVNLAGWWEPEQVEGLRIQAGVYNIFDKTHWNPVGVRDVNPTSVSSSNQPVDFYSEPGRTFKISITKTF